MILHDYLDSGNGYKCRLLLALTQTPYTLELHDINKGATRTDEFLQKNPDGRIPVLETDNGEHLAQSNAILYYLSQTTAWWPSDPWTASKALQWMFFEQYSHEPYVAVARFILRHEPAKSPRHAELSTCHSKGMQALNVMDDHLSHNEWFVGRHPTIADIALYAYSHVADEGGFTLDSFVNVNRWLDQIRTLPGYVAIDHHPGSATIT